MEIDYGRPPVPPLREDDHAWAVVRIAEWPGPGA
jgi:hypothetical protein